MTDLDLPPIVLGCGKAKRKTPAHAVDMYTSAFNRAAARWALSVAPLGRVYVLSAGYGLIPGAQTVAPYDVTFNRTGYAGGGAATGKPVTVDRIREQAAELGLEGADVIVLAGTEYAARLHAAGLKVHRPFVRAARRRNGNARTGYQAALLNAHHGRLPT